MRASALPTASLFLMLAQSPAALGDCRDGDFEPYKEPTKLVCWMKRDNSTSYDGALFTPLRGGIWLGWLYQTVFFAEPIVMKETYNDCTGVGLVGERSDQTYAVSIEETQARIAGTITDKETLRKVSFDGECQIISEDEWSLVVRQNNSK